MFCDLAHCEAGMPRLNQNAEYLKSGFVAQGRKSAGVMLSLIHETIKLEI